MSFLSVPGCIVPRAVAFPGLKGKAAGSGMGPRALALLGKAAGRAGGQLPTLSRCAGSRAGTEGSSGSASPGQHRRALC